MIFLKDTLIHELLHTCEGCMDHGNIWRSYAEKMNRHYGYKISRCASEEDMNEEMLAETLKTKKYVITCQDCNNKTYYVNNCKTVKNPHFYRCKCGGKLKSEKIIH